MATSTDDTIQHETSTKRPISPPSEKPTDTNHSNKKSTEPSTEDLQDTKVNQYTLITQLWSWMTSTTSSTTCATSSSQPHPQTFSRNTTNEKTPLSFGTSSLPPTSAQEALRSIITDEPREPGFKYKGSAPSRGTHCDYPATRDALWTGGGNRTVPDGLRKLAAGNDGNDQDENQSAAPGGSGGGEDQGDDGKEEGHNTEKGGEAGGAEERTKEERVPLQYKRVGNRRKPKHRPGVWPYRGGTTTWERWGLIFRGRVFPKHCDYGPDCTC